MTGQFDAIVIGTGQAGPALAVRCRKVGLKTAIIECHRFGGTWVNNGPRRSLIDLIGELGIATPTNRQRQ